MRQTVSSPRQMESGHWAHFFLLTFVLLAAELVVRVSFDAQDGAWLGALGRALPAAPGFLFRIIPLAAGISSALAYRHSRGTRKRLLRLGGAATLLMLMLDLGFPGEPTVIGERVVLENGTVVSNPVFSDFDRVSLSSVVMAGVRGDLPRVGEHLREYPPGHDRAVVGLAIVKGGYLFLPGILIALIAGLLAWVEREIRFVNAGSEKRFRLVLAWSAAPAIYAVAHLWSLRMLPGVLFLDRALPSILIPYVPLAILAWVAWSTIPQESATRELVH